MIWNFALKHMLVQSGFLENHSTSNSSVMNNFIRNVGALKKKIVLNLTYNKNELYKSLDY